MAAFQRETEHTETGRLDLITYPKVHLTYTLTVSETVTYPPDLPGPVRFILPFPPKLMLLTDPTVQNPTGTFRFGDDQVHCRVRPRPNPPAAPQRSRAP